MKIAFFHTDVWPPHEGSSLQSWQLFTRLNRHHTVTTSGDCPFPGATRTYGTVRDARKVFADADAVLLIVDGIVNHRIERLSCFPFFLGLDTPVFWLLNAPVEESLVISEYDRRLFPVHRAFRTFMSSFVDTCICVSSNLEEYAKTHLRARSYRTIPNGSDPDFFRPAPKKRRRTFDVVWAGSGWNPWHALDTVARTAEILARRDPSVRFTLVTDTPWHAMPPLPNIRMAGIADYFRMPEILGHADAALCLYRTLLPSGFYNSPLKLFDAMAMGIVPIATDTGQNHEVIRDGFNGLLTDNSPEHVASKILYLKHHPQSARTMKRNARKQAVSYYNWDRMVRDIENVMSSAKRGVS